jgi:hypothetical protein
MMRFRLALLTLLAACVSQAFAGAPAGAVEPASGALASVQAPSARAPRAWPLTLSPAPGDLALVQIAFRRSPRQGLSSRSLRVSVRGAFGDHYLAVAVPRSSTPSGARALVLLVNRRSALLDPVRVHLRVSARRALGAATVWRLTDPLSRPTSGLTPALCDLPLRGGSLSGSRLRSLGSHGRSLTGFAPAEAVAQAYDLTCGLPYAGSFKQALAPACSPSASTPGALCCPPNAICAPAPTPPAPVPPPPAPPPEAPGCKPCAPPPGYACPLAQSPSVCITPASAGARRAVLGAH